MQRIRLAIWAAALVLGAPAAAQTAPVPVPPLGSLVRADDYPPEAFRQNEQGTVRFRLDIGTKGEVRGCSILASSGSASLDAAACRIMGERARFRPATNKAGRAVPSTVEQNLTWRLAPSTAPPSRLAALVRIWGSCLGGEAAKLIPSPTAAERIADQAFMGCAQSESLFLAEISSAAAPGARASETPEDVKRQFRRRILDEIEKARNELAMPRAARELTP